MRPRTGRRIGYVMLGLALAGGIGIFVTRGDDGPRTTATTLPPSVGVTAGPAPPSVEAPIPVGSGTVLVPVAEVPGATALQVVGDEVRATDGATGARTTVDAATGEVTGPVTFGSLRRLDRAVTDPDGGWWVAEADALHRLDADGEVVDTVLLDVPAAIHSVDADAVWLTVSGLPGSHSETAASTQSYVVRVDRSTTEAVVRGLDDPATFRVAIDTDGVWVTVGRTLYRLDRATLDPVAEAELADPASALVRHGDEVLAVVDAAAPVLARFDAVDLTPLATVDLGPGDVGTAAVVGALPTDADGSVGAPELWVLRPGEGVVTRVDLVAGTVADLSVPAPRRIEVDEDGRVWLLSGAAAGTLLRLEDA